MTLLATAWIDQRDTDLLKARGEAIRRVKQAFEAADIVMPEPIYRLRIDGRGAPLSALLAESVPSDGRTGGTAGGQPDNAASASGSASTARARRPSTMLDDVPVDTSADDATRATLDREVRRAGDGPAGGERNLLDGAPGHE